MRNALRLIALSALLVLSGCAEDLEETDSGGVVLEVEFDNSIFQIGVNDQDLVTLNTVTIDSLAIQPGGTTSALQDIRLQTIELTYTRTDTGTRVPPAFVYQLTGTIPVNGTLTFNNMPIMTVNQLESPPLSDLLFENGAIDRETGAQIIRMNVTIRVFGRTIAGTDVVSSPVSQTFEFIPSLITPT